MGVQELGFEKLRYPFGPMGFHLDRFMRIGYGAMNILVIFDLNVIVNLSIL